MASILDNRNKTMEAALRESLKKAESVDIQSAFFYFSGFNLLADDLKDKKVRILIGMTIDPSLEVIADLQRELKENPDVPLATYAVRGHSALNNNQKIQKYIDSFVMMVNESPLSNQYDSSQSVRALDIFLKKIEDGSLEMKILKNQKDHSKVYLINYPEQVELIEGTNPKGVAYVGSSNFTYNGLIGQGELNVDLPENENYEMLKAHFDQLWDSGETLDIANINNQYFVEQLKERLNVYAKPSPFDIYLRILFELYSSTENEKILTPSKITHKRYDDFRYQLDAIKQGIDCINKNNGVILADVVGLGKSIIASAIARNIDVEHTIVICPPHLIDQWKEYTLGFGLRGADVWSSGKIEQLRDKLASEKNPQPTMFIIDEAHRYRNENNITYTYLHQIVRSNPDNKVMLLTATPYNNRPQDFFSLIKLFQTPRKSTINTVENLDVEFTNLINTYDKLSKKAKKEERDEEINARLEELGARLRALINPVVVRRSRIDLQEIDVYREDLNAQGIQFPEVVGPELFEYDLGSIEDLYADTLKDISGNFLCAKYFQTNYLVDEAKFKSKYGDLFAEKDIKESQKNLADFMKNLLVRRFESSVVAFRNTLDRMINSYEKMVKWWDKGYVPISLRGGSDISDPTDEELEDFFADCDEFDETDIDYDKLNKKRFYPFPKDLFNEKYIEDINSDLSLLKSIKQKWFPTESIPADPKYDVISSKIKELLKDDPRRKIVVFSSFTDTAKYVQSRLVEDGLTGTIFYCGSSSKSDREKVRRNFDASSDEKQDPGCDVLVATDALSEGSNLNRAGVVINYDIPYNPTIVIQRIGRINRINKKMFDRIYIYNCFPTKIGEENTLVKGISTLKMLLIEHTVGSDTKTLTQEESLTSYFQNEYKKADEKSDEKSWDVEYRNLYEKYKNNVKIKDEIDQIPTRSKIRRIDRKDEASIAYVRKGETQFFAMVDKTGKCTTVPPEVALEYFKAESDEEPQDLTPDFDSKMAAIDAFIDKPKTKVPPTPNKKKAIEKIDTLYELSSQNRAYLEDLKMVLVDYSDLTDHEIRKIANLKINKNDVSESMDDLKEIIPVQYINSIHDKVSNLDSSLKHIEFMEEITK